MPCAVILTALPVEYSAVRAHLTDLREETHPQGTIYERGRFLGNGQEWEVGIAEVGAGNAGAAVEAERAIAHFKPDILFFVGIAGGIKDVEIGDVVAATKVYSYESGKVGEQFFPRPALGQSAYALVQRAKREAEKIDWLQRLTSSSASRPRVFVAPIAAGEKVVASKESDVFSFIRASYNDAIAVEMEGFGFLSAAFAYPNIKAIVIRGISDLIEDKNANDPVKGSEKERQDRASRNASAFTFEVLAKIQIEEIRSSSNRLAIIFNTNSYTSIHKTQIETIVANLRQLSGDSSLKIVGIERGSIILILEGSLGGIEQLESLHQASKIPEILGLKIRNVSRVDLNERTIQERFGISCDFYLSSQSYIERILQERINITPEEELFGVEENLSVLKRYLMKKEDSWFISIAGSGGIGKTSLAEKLVRDYAALSGFEKLAWVTAQKERFSLISEEVIKGKNLNIGAMLHEIAEQLEIQLPAARNNQLPYLREKLCASPYLIVIDNLETLEEYESFLSQFDINSSQSSFRPSKIIFTSRRILRKPYIKEREIRGLSEKATFDLIRYKGEDVESINAATDNQLSPIYLKTEGNPLLIKLVVSLIKRYEHNLLLDEIIHFLDTQNALLKYLYSDALRSISDNAQKVIYAMTSYYQDGGVPFNRLKDSTGLTDSELIEAIQECVSQSSLLSLLPYKPGEERRYSIHNLLYEYLNGEST